MAAVLLTAGCSGYQAGGSWGPYTAARMGLGGLRTDRNPADAVFDAGTLERNFPIVALGAEPNPVGEQPGERRLEPGILRRWETQIRWAVANDSPTAARDVPVVGRTFERLARITGVDIAPAGAGTEPNIFILFLRPEDYPSVAASPPMAPGGRWLTGFIHRFGRSPTTPCVATFTASGPDDPDGQHRIIFSIVLIRADLPARLAEACIEEELAQTMGLPNDADDIRPSIFNDDQEFALLTRHDEALLRILYDPRLRPGMTEREIAPLLRDLAESAAR